jgi:aminopeptidase YwaD
MAHGGVDLCGMVSLEMLGYCDQRTGSQSLPRTLQGLYPETGNFIAVIGNERSRRLVAAFRAGLERIGGLPVESLAVPGNGEWLQATRLSDHSPFWDAGYAALMITDTSFLRNPHYHLPSDTPETLDMEFLHKVAQGCLEAVRGIVAEGIPTLPGP